MRNRSLKVCMPGDSCPEAGAAAVPWSRRGPAPADGRSSLPPGPARSRASAREAIAQAAGESGKVAFVWYATSGE